MADRNPSRGRRLQVAMQDSVMHYSRGMFITQARTGAAALRPTTTHPAASIRASLAAPTITSIC
jgi:hypothetical protein